MAGLNILYHPHFEPDIATLRSTLLIGDAVHSIVPQGANFIPSDRLRRHVDALPGTFVTVSPEEDDIEITKDYSVLDALRRAFRQIAAQDEVRSFRERILSTNFDDGETLRLDGAVFLHNAKVVYSVYDALREAGLIFGERDGYYVVNNQAADLIVSFLAQRMSHRLAMRTLTGVDASFLLSTACDVYDGVIPDRNALFSSAVLRLHIPEDVASLTEPQYLELRSRYRDLREKFPLYLRDLFELYRANDARSLADLRAIIDDVARSIDTEQERIKSSRLGEKVRRWTPVGLTSALAIGAGFLADGMTAGLMTAGGTVAIGMISGIMDRRPLHGHFEGVRSLLLSAREDIMRARKLPEYLNPEPLY
jgi:hypothetical protein